MQFQGPSFLLADPCTRPGPQGLTVVSSGLADLDQVLGGGLPLGAITLLLDDGCSSLHETIIQYFLAEGAVTGQVRKEGGGGGGCQERVLVSGWVPGQARAGACLHKGTRCLHAGTV